MIYVCSDIHGLFDLYQKAIDLMSPMDEMYIVGDVIDRGQYGIDILKDIMKRSNIHLLIGNHEDMMLRSLYYHDSHWTSVWKMVCNGGGITDYLFSKEDTDLQKDILDYLVNCYLTKHIEVCGSKFVLTHAGPAFDTLDTKYIEASDELRLRTTWYSAFRNDDMYIDKALYNEDARYIVGHVPVQKLGREQIYMTDNIINIDCGCAYQHLRDDTSLGVLRLDDMKTWQLT